MARKIKHMWKKRAVKYLAIGFVICLSIAVAYAGSVPYTFTAGTTAKADEVNTNFSELSNRIDELKQVLSHGRFVATQNEYDGTGSTAIANSACVSEYGTGYRVADWNDIVSFYNGASEATVKEFYINLNLKPYYSYGWREASYFISYNDSEIYSGNRHYFLTRHDQNTPGHYLSHANINSHELDLGSWYTTAYVLCYKQ